MGVRLPSPESGGTSGGGPRPKRGRLGDDLIDLAAGKVKRYQPKGRGSTNRTVGGPYGSPDSARGAGADVGRWVTEALGLGGPGQPVSESGNGPGDGGFGAWLSGQTDSTNGMYDQMLAILGKQVGGGRLAINAAQRDLTNELRDLGRESTRTHRDVSRQIARRGSQSLADLERALGTERADLGRSGADLKALLAEGLNSRTALRSAGDRRSTVNDRLAQLMGDDIGNYQRFGETNKAGYTQALSSAEALQRAQLEMQRAEALQALAGSGGGFGGGGGGGGGGSGYGSDGKPIDQLAAGKKVASDTDSYVDNLVELGFERPNIGQYYDELESIGDPDYQRSVRTALEMSIRQDDPDFLLNMINDPSSKQGDGQNPAGADYNVAWGLAQQYRNFMAEQRLRQGLIADIKDDGAVNQSPNRRPQRGLKNMIRSIYGG